MKMSPLVLFCGTAVFFMHLTVVTPLTTKESIFNRHLTQTAKSANEASPNLQEKKTSNSYFPLFNLFQRFKLLGSTKPRHSKDQKDISTSRVSGTHTDVNSFIYEGNLQGGGGGNGNHFESKQDGVKRDSPFAFSGFEYKGERRANLGSTTSFPSPTSASSSFLLAAKEEENVVADPSRENVGLLAKQKIGDYEGTDRLIEERAAGNLKIELSRTLQREQMLIPTKTRNVVMIQSLKDSVKQEKPGKNSTGSFSVSERIKEFASKAGSVPRETDFVRIGDAMVPREKVSAIGDVDSNKMDDYIVANLAARNYSGTVRLYLMAEDKKFLYTRDLVPGKWGFEHADLNPGDRYGSTVFRLSSSVDSSQCFIAITAPGDRTVKDMNGAVYILELSDKGDVKNHTKLPATDFLDLVEQQKKEETVRSPKARKNSQVARKEELQHLQGVTSMVFLNASGGVAGFMNVKTPKDKDILHRIDTHLAQVSSDRGLPVVGKIRVSSRLHDDTHCVFNKTHCDCKYGTQRSHGECYELFESTEADGKQICIPKDCPRSYFCSCEGNKVCLRVETEEEVYVPTGRGRNGETYCAAERHTVMKSEPIPT